MRLKPHPPCTEPHDIWIKVPYISHTVPYFLDYNYISGNGLATGILFISNTFFQFLHERIEVAKYCSQDQIEMYTELLQRTLDIQVFNNLELIKGKFLPYVSQL